MPAFGPLIILIPVLGALYFCEWEVVAAFFLAVLVVPFTLLFLAQLYEAATHHKPMDFNGLLKIGSLFSLAEIPIYFIMILPTYYLLKSASNIPIVYSFTCSIAVVIFILFSLFTTRSWRYKEFLIVAAFNFLHALFVIWLIAKLKSTLF